MNAAAFLFAAPQQPRCRCGKFDALYHCPACQARDGRARQALEDVRAMPPLSAYTRRQARHMATQGKTVREFLPTRFAKVRDQVAKGAR